MARRKRRGLGGTSEHHESRAKEARFTSTSLYKAATINAAAGHCGRAFRDLMDGNRYSSGYYTHASEAGIRPNKIESADMAVQTFVKNCLVGASLSGMRRRSRRK